MKQIMTLVGAGFAAIAASACCILPAVLGIGGAGTLGFSAALTPYRPYLMGMTALLLGAAFYFTYRPSKGACDAKGHCSADKTKGPQRLSKAILWGVTVLTAGAMSYPMIADSRAAIAANQTPGSLLMGPKSDAATKTVVFTVGNVTCASCVPHIVEALKKTRGVQQAKVDFPTKRAIVRYDAAQVDVAKLRAAIEGAGYSATPITKEGLSLGK